MIEEITFKHPGREHLSIIFEWFKKPHVSEFMEDPEIGRAMPDLQNYISGNDYFFTPWLVFLNNKPVAYFSTAEVQKHEAGVWSKWREKTGRTYSLEVLIGDEALLGKGLAHQIITKFIEDEFPKAKAFLVDAELRNLRAIHVFEKAGFVIVDEFKVEHGRFVGMPHVMMKRQSS